MVQSNWIRSGEVAAILGVSKRLVPRIAESEAIRVKRLPSTYDRFYKPDVMALAQRCVLGGPVPEGELAAV